MNGKQAKTLRRMHATRLIKSQWAKLPKQVKSDVRQEVTNNFLDWLETAKQSPFGQPSLPQTLNYLGYL